MLELFDKKTIVQLLLNAGFAVVLIYVLYMDYKKDDRYMDIYEKQSTESAAAQVKLATALEGLKDAVNK